MRIIHGTNDICSSLYFIKHINKVLHCVNSGEPRIGINIEKELKINRETIKQLPITKKHYKLLNKVKVQKGKEATCRPIIFKPADLSKIYDLIPDYYRHRTSDGREVIPVMPSIGMGEFFSFLEDGFNWDFANAWGGSLLLAGIVMGGDAYSDVEIDDNNYMECYKEMDLIKTRLSAEGEINPSIYKVYGKAIKKIKVKLNYIGMYKVAELLGMDFLMPPEDSYSMGEKHTIMCTKTVISKLRKWQDPKHFSEMLMRGYYTEYLFIKKKNGWGFKNRVVNNIFVCPVCGMANSQCDEEVHTCGRCLSQGVNKDFQIEEIDTEGCILFTPPAYYYDFSINGTVSRLLAMNYGDGSLVDVSNVEKEILGNEVMSYIKARARLSVCNQYVNSRLTNEELHSIKRNFISLEIIPLSSWDDIYGLLSTEAHCLCTTFIQHNKRKKLVMQGFCEKYINKQGNEGITFTPPKDVNVDNWKYMCPKGTNEDADVFNYNSIPEMKELMLRSLKKDIIIIVPKIDNCYNGFSKNYSFEISSIDNTVKVLFNGSTTVIEYDKEMIDILLNYDMIKTEGAFIKIERIKELTSCAAVKLSANIGKSDSEHEYKTIRSNVFKTFIIRVPDWQQNIMGVQLGPVKRRRVNFNIEFLSHLVSRCLAWPISFHGLTEYAIVSSFSRVEKENMSYNIYDIGYEDIPDHVFCAYNLYLREQLSTYIVSELNMERKLGFSRIMAGAIEGGMSLIGKYIKELGKNEFYKHFTEKGSNVNWLLSAQWEEIEKSIKSWEKDIFRVKEMDEIIETRKIKKCEHGAIKVDYEHGCSCCGRKIAEDQENCGDCAPEGEIEHKCNHICSGSANHFCKGEMITSEIYEGMKMKCGHDAVNCLCCGNVSCTSPCFECFDTSNDDRMIKELIVREMSEKTDLSVMDSIRAGKRFASGKALTMLDAKRQVTEKAKTGKGKKKKHKAEMVQRQTESVKESSSEQEGKTKETGYVMSDNLKFQLENMFIKDDKQEQETRKEESEEEENDRTSKTIITEEEYEHLITRSLMSELQNITSEEYVKVIKDKDHQMMMNGEGDTISIKYAYSGVLCMDIDAIDSIAIIGYEFEPNYCLRDSFKTFYPDLADAQWEDICIDSNADSQWTISSDIPSIAKEMRKNIIVINTVDDRVISAYGYCEDPALAFNTICFTSREVDASENELRGHYQPCTVVIKKNLILPPVYNNLMSRQDIEEIWFNCTGTTDLSEFYKKNLESRLRFALTCNKMELVEEYSIGHPDMKIVVNNLTTRISNNTQGINEPDKGKLNFVIPDFKYNMYANALEIYSRTAYERFCLENCITSHEIEDEVKLIRNKALATILGFVNIRLSVMEVESKTINKNTMIANVVSDVRIKHRKGCSILEHRDEFDKLKTGDIITLVYYGKFTTMQIKKNIKRVMIPSLKEFGLYSSASVYIYKQSFCSLCIELYSILNTDVSLVDTLRLLKESKVIKGYPGTGKTRNLVELCREEKGLVIGVTRGSQESLKKEALGKKMMVTSMEKACIFKPRSEVVYIDEASLVTIERLMSVLTKKVKRLVISGDLSQIPAKEFSDIIAYEPVNILDFANAESDDIIELKQTWRFGQRLCTIINSAFGLDMVSALSRDTTVNLAHISSLTQQDVARVIIENRIQIVFCFTMELENRLRKITKDLPVKIARVHSSQGITCQRGMIVQDFRRGPLQGSNEIQFNRQYLLVACTRCTDHVSILCTYESCRNKQQDNDSIVKHLNRELDLGWIERGSGRERVNLVESVMKFIETSKLMIKGLKPNMVIDWLTEFKMKILTRQMNYYIGKLKYAIDTGNLKEVKRIVNMFDCKMIEDICYENEKFYAVINYETTDWGWLKKLTSKAFMRKQEIKIENNEVFIGGVRIMGDKEWTTVDKLRKDFDIVKDTKVSKLHYRIKEMNSTINENECETINMNIRIISHAVNLFGNATEQPLPISFRGNTYFLRCTVGCSLMAGIEIRNERKEIVMFTNNIYPNWSRRELQYMDEEDELTGELVRLWDERQNDGQMWELTEMVCPNVDHRVLHALMWVERFHTAIEGLMQGKTINEMEGHLFRNDLGFNERMLNRYKNKALEKGIRITNEVKLDYSFMKCSSFLWNGVKGRNRVMVYFEEHLEPVCINNKLQVNKYAEIARKLWEQELFRFPFNFSTLATCKDVEIQGHKEIINRLGIDIDRHRTKGTRLAAMIEKDILNLLDTRQVLEPELFVPNDFLEDCKEMDIDKTFNLNLDNEITDCGIGYIIDSYVAKIASLNSSKTDIGMVTRYTNITMRQDIERQVKVLNFIGMDVKKYHDDVMRRISDKERIIEDILQSGKTKTSEKTGRLKENLEAYKHCIRTNNTSMFIEPTGKKFKTDLIVMGLTGLTMGISEIKKMSKERGDSECIMMIPDFRRNEISNKCFITGNKLVFNGESLDYKVHDDWMELINKMVNKGPTDSFNSGVEIGVVGMSDLLITLKVTGRHNMDCSMLPVNYRNDEIVISVPRMSSMKTIAKTGEIFEKKEVTVERETLSRLVKRALTPGCTLQMLQTIARNRLSSVVISKRGRIPNINRNILKDSAICALAANSIANHHNNELNRFMSDIEDNLLDNKDVRRTFNALKHLIKHEMNTVIASALDIKFSLEEVTEVVNNFISMSISGDNQLKKNRIEFKKQPHRILFSEHFYKAVDIKDPDKTSINLEPISRFTKRFFESISTVKDVERSKSYWPSKLKEIRKERIDELSRSKELKVSILKYDLTGGLLQKLGKVMFHTKGEEIMFHSSVKINDIEITYGNGICVDKVGKLVKNMPYKEIYIGKYSSDEINVVEVVDEMDKIFTHAKYSPAGLNCNMFSLALLEKLRFYDERRENVKINAIIEIHNTVKNIVNMDKRLIQKLIAESDLSIRNDASEVERIMQNIDLMMTFDNPVTFSDVRDQISQQMYVLCGKTIDELFEKEEGYFDAEAAFIEDVQEEVSKEKDVSITVSDREIRRSIRKMVLTEVLDDIIRSVLEDDVIKMVMNNQKKINEDRIKKMISVKKKIDNKMLKKQIHESSSAEEKKLVKNLELEDIYDAIKKSVTKRTGEGLEQVAELAITRIEEYRMDNEITMADISKHKGIRSDFVKMAVKISESICDMYDINEKNENNKLRLKDRLALYNKRTRLDLSKFRKLNGKYLVVAYGSYGDTIPVMRICDILRRLGAWICIVTHFDCVKPSIECYDAIEKINISQKETGNKKQNSMDEAFNYHVKVNMEVAKAVSNALERFKFDYCFTSPIVPASTGVCKAKGKLTCEMFCTAAWEVDNELAINEFESDGSKIEDIKKSMVDAISPILWPIARQTLSNICLETLQMEQQEVIVVPRIVLSWAEVHSENIRNDKLSIFAGYTSDFNKNKRAYKPDNGLKAFITFGSMKLDDNKVTEVSKIVKLFNDKKIEMVFHVQNEHENRKYIDEVKKIIANPVIKKGRIDQGEEMLNSDICVNHGGIGTVQECLLTSCVPFVIPVFADQPYIANNLEKNRIGYRLGDNMVENVAKLARACDAQLVASRLDVSINKTVENILTALEDLENLNREASYKSEGIATIGKEEQKTAEKEHWKASISEIRPKMRNIGLKEGVYKTDLNVREEDLMKTSETFSGKDCLKRSIEYGARLIDAETENKAKQLLSLMNINRSSDVSLLYYVALVCKFNIQITGWINNSLIISKMWPLISIYVTKPKVINNELISHAFTMVPCMNVKMTNPVYKGKVEIGSVCNIIELRDTLSLRTNDEVDKILGKILRIDGADMDHVWMNYGGYSNVLARLTLKNIESIVEKDVKLVCKVDNIKIYDNLIMTQSNSYQTDEIGEIFIIICNNEVRIGVLIASTAGCNTIYTEQRLSPLPIFIKARLIKKTSSRHNLLSRKVINEVGDFLCLNPNTAEYVKGLIPGVNSRIFKETDLENEKCKIVASYFETRIHHGQRSMLEREVIMKEIGNHERLITIPRRLSNDEVRVIKTEGVGHFTYINASLWLDIEFEDSEFLEIISEIISKLTKGERISYNNRTCLRVSCEDINAIIKVRSILGQCVDVVRTVVHRPKTRINVGQTISMRRTDLMSEFSIMDSIVSNTIMDEVFYNQEEITVQRISDKNCIGRMRAEIFYGLTYIKEEKLLITLRPLTVLKIMKKPSGGNEEEPSAIHNIEPFDQLMDQELDKVVGPAPGKINENRYNRWLQQNKWLNEEESRKNASKNMQIKNLIRKQKFVWEEIYFNVHADGVSAPGVYDITKGYDASAKHSHMITDNLYEIDEKAKLNMLEDHRIMDLWDTNRDIIDHVVIHCNLNEQRYNVKEGQYGIHEVVKTTFSKYPEKCRPVFNTEAYASLNSLTGRIGRSLVLRNTETKYSTEETIELMAELFFVKNWKEMVEYYKDNPIVYNETDFKNWIAGHKNAHKVVKELETLSAEGPMTNPFNVFRTHVKLESINKPEAIMDMRQSAPRAIVWLPYCMPALFSYIFKIASNRLKMMLRKDIHYCSGYDVDKLSEILSGLNEEEVYYFDNDISRMDSQIDEQLIKVEWHSLGMLGTNIDILETYKTLKPQWKIANRLVSTTGSWLRHSGEPTTALGNCLINLAITALSITQTKRKDIRAMFVMGDDMIMLTKRKEDLKMVKEKGKRLANSILKPNISKSCGPFCSFIIGNSVITRKPTIVPNVLRLSYKWEVPNGQHEVTDESVFTRQLSYICMLGQNSLAKSCIKKIKRITDNELPIPNYYSEADLIKLNCDTHGINETELIETMNALYNSITEPETTQRVFNISSENIRKVVGKMSQLKQVNFETETKMHSRLTHLD
jgi:hypothetical protein